jgi:hypothetical protein
MKIRIKNTKLNYTQMDIIIQTPAPINPYHTVSPARKRKKKKEKNKDKKGVITSKAETVQA